MCEGKWYLHTPLLEIESVKHFLNDNKVYMLHDKETQRIHICNLKLNENVSKNLPREMFP